MDLYERLRAGEQSAAPEVRLGARLGAGKVVDTLSQRRVGVTPLPVSSDSVAMISVAIKPTVQMRISICRPVDLLKENIDLIVQSKQEREVYFGKLAIHGHLPNSVGGTFEVTFAGCAIAAAWIRSERFHKFLVPAFGLLFLAYIALLFARL